MGMWKTTLIIFVNRVWKGKMTIFWVEVWCAFREYRNDEVFPFSFGISLHMLANAWRDWGEESKIAEQEKSAAAPSNRTLRDDVLYLHCPIW